MKEFKPFNKVESVQTDTRRPELDTAGATEMFPLLLVSATVPGAVRDFRPQAVIDPPAVDEKVQAEEPSDVDPKVVTSSALDSVIDSGVDSTATILTLHPSHQPQQQENPAHVVKESNESSESPETMNSGFTLPPVLE